MAPPARAEQPTNTEMTCASPYGSDEESDMDYNLETRLKTLPNNRPAAAAPPQDSISLSSFIAAEEDSESESGDNHDFDVDGMEDVANEELEEEGVEVQEEVDFGDDVEITSSLQQFMLHSSTVLQNEKSDLIPPGEHNDGGTSTVATNIADDGQGIFEHQRNEEARTKDQPKQYTPEQLSDPEWCKENIELGTEINYPVEEVMKHVPKLTLGEIAMVELYNIVAKHSSSLGAFDDIVELINRHMLTGGFNKDVSMPTRKTFVAAMKKKFPCQAPMCTKLDPTSVDHGVPDDNGVILDETIEGSSSIPTRSKNLLSIFAWDAERQIKESLICPRLYGNEDNMVVNEGNPFSRYVPHSSPNEIGTEILSGGVYQDTHKALVKDPEKEHLAAYHMYMDKLSSGDSQQRYNGEPVAIVCAYLKRTFRNMVKNWIVLGFLPDMELDSAAKKKKRYQGKRGKVSY